MRADGQSGTLRLAELYAPIADDLEQCRRILADELISDQTLISDLCQHVGQFHGKMLRPVLLLLAGQACGGLQPAHRVLAAVVELVHLATLVHDDVLDGSDIRRRAATVNRLWGHEQAILLGDFLYSHAYHLCSGLGDQYAAQLIARAAVTVCEGEMMQVSQRGNLALTEPEYLDIIARKTAALVEASCRLGAHYAAGFDAGDARGDARAAARDSEPRTNPGGDADLEQRLGEYGRSLGVAFQIVDDLLDLLGDEAEAGKSLGRDLAQGELTLPLIHFLANADAGRRRKLRDCLQAPADGDGRTDHAGAAVAALLRGSESVAYAQARATEYVEAARAALAPLPPSPARDSLLALAEFVLVRRQ